MISYSNLSKSAHSVFSSALGSTRKLFLIFSDVDLCLMLEMSVSINIILINEGCLDVVIDVNYNLSLDLGLEYRGDREENIIHYRILSNLRLNLDYIRFFIQILNHTTYKQLILSSIAVSLIR